MTLLLTPEQFVKDKEARASMLSALEDPASWGSIPLLNYTPIHQLLDNSLVRFRGMVQDMLDPEIYLERYQVKSEQNTEAAHLQEGKYRDCLQLRSGEQVDYDSSENVHGERRTLFLVSIPGLNQWTQDYEQHCNKRNLPAPSENGTANVRKRPVPDEHEAMECEAGDESGSNKRQCLSIQGAAVRPYATPGLAPEYLINSPIPSRPGKACMVKIYEDFDAHKLNTVVDVVGYLSVDPGLDGSTYDFEMGEDFSFNELKAQNPPPSLIPRLHAIAVRPLQHLNPLLDALLPATAAAEPFEMHSTQQDLHKLLTLCLFNDKFAADYLLAHLISTVYNRGELQCVGKFALNICNVPTSVASVYTKKLYEILELLLPASHYLPMTLETMNTESFVPKKDYETNKLVSGLLQLAPHTHLVLDESQLQQGQLDSSGVMALRSLAQLIKDQQIKCNFQYYDIDYDADIPVLVLSEGRSLLTVDFGVPIETDDDAIKLIDEALKAAHHYLQPARLDKFRRYLTKAKISTFDLNAEQSEMVQQEFVTMRQQKVANSLEALNSYLVLSRLLGISRGKAMLDNETWQLAKSMETERVKRLKRLMPSGRQGRQQFEL